MNTSINLATVFVDSDNTLWDTNTVFADAQLNLLTAVEDVIGISAPDTDRLKFLRKIDQVIAERHHAGLRYPPRLLVHATELTLRGMRAEDAARSAWRGNKNLLLNDEDVAKIEQRFFSDLMKTPAIRPGVLAGLRNLKKMGCIMLIITEGAKEKVKNNVDRLKLAQFFERVIEGRKTPELYRRVHFLAGMPAMAFMVGDQLDKDIAPAKTAGLRTIYFPGGFQPDWLPDVSVVQPDFTINSFIEIPSIVSGTIINN